MGAMWNVCGDYILGDYGTSGGWSAYEASYYLLAENAENLTATWRRRNILKGGKKVIEGIGPIDLVPEEVIQLSRSY